MMTALNLLYATLVLHICGLTLWAGSTVAEFILFKQLWKIYGQTVEKSHTAYRFLSRLQPLAKTGMILLVLTGVAMFLITGGVFGSHTWFKIKLVLVFLAAINSLVIGRKLRSQLQQLSNGKTEENLNYIAPEAVKRLTTIFYISQLLLFQSIFICSIFKFN